jgi:hypothetical protein
MLHVKVDFDPHHSCSIDKPIDAWLPLTFAVNSINPSSPISILSSCYHTSSTNLATFTISCIAFETARTAFRRDLSLVSRRLYQSHVSLRAQVCAASTMHA